MSRSLFLPTALFATVLVATPAFAKEPFGGPDPDKLRQRAEHAFQAVDATPRQREAAWSILDGAIEEMRTFRDQGRELRERLVHAFVANDTIDRREVNSLRTDLVRLFDRASERGFDLLADVAEVFTPAQRQELRNLRQEHTEGKDGRRGQRSGDTVPL